jgi:hypothetical protein
MTDKHTRMHILSPEVENTSSKQFRFVEETKQYAIVCVDSETTGFRYAFAI